jgi:hypothetical protein
VQHEEQSVGGITSAERFLKFVWEGQSGVFELCPWPNSREHFDRSTALASLRGKRFFAPLARRHPGSTKADVAEVGNVLWADIDDLEARNLINARLRAYHLAPSALVFSGQKGYWVYIKLSVPIPTPQIEHLNKGLATLLDGDRCWNCDRIARLPGSIHPDSYVRQAVSAEGRRLRSFQGRTANLLHAGRSGLD